MRIYETCKCNNRLRQWPLMFLHPLGLPVFCVMFAFAPFSRIPWLLLPLLSHLALKLWHPHAFPESSPVSQRSEKSHVLMTLGQEYKSMLTTVTILPLSSQIWPPTFPHQLLYCHTIAPPPSPLSLPAPTTTPRHSHTTITSTTILLPLMKT